jgi:hypothetical protein
VELKVSWPLPAQTVDILLYTFLHLPIASPHLTSKYPPQHPVLKHPQPMFFPSFETCTKQQMGRWQILSWMIAGIVQIEWVLNFCVNIIWICYYHSQDLNFITCLKDLFAVCMLWSCSALLTLSLFLFTSSLHTNGTWYKVPYLKAVT